MNEKSKVLTIIWTLVVAFLTFICIYEYRSLSNNLQSIYDEGFFYIITVCANQSVTSTPLLSLAMDLITALIPNIEQLDILSMRQYAFITKAVALIFLILSSCIYIYQCYSEKHCYTYLSLIASYLLIATALLPSIVFNVNDVVLILVSLTFSFCLLYSAFSNKIIQYCIVVLIGIVAFFMLLCNMLAGCMLILFCIMYLALRNNLNVYKIMYTLLCGLLGIIIGIGITHFCVISIEDCYEFLQNAITKTTNGGRASHHSLTKVVLVILLGIRDLSITTLVLCGITYVCRIIHKHINKDWLTILVAFICVFIVYKWQIKPTLTIASVLCWLMIMFLNCHMQLKDLKKNEILLILFAFMLPIGSVFGTNTSIIGKALLCGAPWGFLVFYLYYLLHPKMLKYFLAGITIIVFFLLGPIISNITKEEADLHFDYEKPIARMNLTIDQKNYYEEVYQVLSKSGYVGRRDTVLGFCFNEMTVVAMGAIPYTSDQQPEEFLLHNINCLPSPKHIILSEWDSIVLYDYFSRLDWNFPNGYHYYKCTYNPDPNADYSMTQSMIYSRK